MRDYWVRQGSCQCSVGPVGARGLPDTALKCGEKCGKGAAAQRKQRAESVRTEDLTFILKLLRGVRILQRLPRA